MPAHPIIPRPGVLPDNVIKSALRTQEGWDSMSPEEQGEYDYHFDLWSTWSAAITEDLVSAGEQWVLECFNDWPDGLQDNVTINGHTTDATRNIIITVAPGFGLVGPNYHGGIVGQGFLSLNDTNFQNNISIQQSNTIVSNIWAHGNAAGATSCINIQSGATECYVYNNIITGNLTGYRGVTFTPPVTAFNNIVINFNDAGGGFNTQNFSHSDIYNNLMADCGLGGGLVGFSSLNRKVYNNIGFNNSIDFNITHDEDSGNNASSDDTATGNNPIINITDAEFFDASNNDYRLAEGSQLIGAGVNLIELGLLPSPQYDITGAQRPDVGPWDLGPYMAGGEPPEPQEGGIIIGTQGVDAVAIGGIPADKVMVGVNQVWPSLP